MTESSSQSDFSNHGKPVSQISSGDIRRSPDQRDLSYEDIYVCPVCHHGQISAMTLMDAFSCNFCRHIFTANLNNQTIRVEDSSQPIIWRWNGRSWQPTNQADVELTLTIWIVAAILVIVPPSLLWLSSHTFPPLQGSSWAWFPVAWIRLTFFLHFFFVGWILVEHHQVPLYVAFKIKLREWFRQR